MTEALAVLLGAIVGGAATIIGGFLAARSNNKALLFESRTRQSHEHQTRVRDQMAEVIRLTYSVEYKVFEASWMAVNDPDRINEDYANHYEAEIAKLLPQLSGALVVLAGLAPHIHTLVKPWSDQVGLLEGEASRTLIAHRTHPDALDRLRSLRQPLIDFYEASPASVAPAYELVARL